MVKPRLEGNLPDLRPLSRTKLQSAWLPPQQEGAQTIRRVLSVSRLSKDPVVLDRGMAEGLASRLQNPCDPHVAAHTLHRTLPSIHRRTTAYRPELDSRDQTRRLSADGPPQRGRRLPAHPQRPRLGNSLPALIVQVVGALRLRSCLIDGEAVCCDGQGVPVFHKLRQRQDDRRRLWFAGAREFCAKSFGTVRSAAFRRSALSLLKTCSIGLRSGEYGGR